jgi:hypothetical protein
MSTVPTQVAMVPMVQSKGVKKPMNKKTMMMIGAGLVLTFIGLIVVFNKNKKTQVAIDTTVEAIKEDLKKTQKNVEVKSTKSDDKKVEAIKEDLKKIEKTILGFKVNEGVSPVMNFLTESAAEVQDFVQNEVCAVINHDDTIKQLEDEMIWRPFPCKGDGPSVETGMKMLNENIRKTEKLAESMSPEIKKHVLSLVKNAEKMVEELEQQVCGDGQSEVKKEDILKVVKDLRRSLCGHVKEKTSKEEADKKIGSVMKLVSSLLFGRLPEARVLEADPKTYRDEKITKEDGVEVPKYR